MSLLFETFKIGSMEIRNRFVRSATTSCWSDKRGIIRSEIIDLYSRLAKGGVGLIAKATSTLKAQARLTPGWLVSVTVTTFFVKGLVSFTSTKT